MDTRLETCNAIVSSTSWNGMQKWVSKCRFSDYIYTAYMVHNRLILGSLSFPRPLLLVLRCKGVCTLYVEQRNLHSLILVRMRSRSRTRLRYNQLARSTVGRRLRAWISSISLRVHSQSHPPAFGAPLSEPKSAANMAFTSITETEPSLCLLCAWEWDVRGQLPRRHSLN